jgi:hypothetical protein
MIDSSAVKAHRSAYGGEGENNSTVGRSRGGRTTKIYVLTEAQCCPFAFMLAGAQAADCVAVAAFPERLPDRAIAGRQQALRRQHHPPSGRGARRDGEHSAQSQTQTKKYFSPLVCCNHNAIERMFCRLETLGAARPGYDRAP